MNISDTTAVNTAVKTLTPRQQARRKAILQAVRSQLADHGYDKLSMRNIAAAASVSPSTLYQIYDSKESLILYAIYDTVGDLLLEESELEPLERFIYHLDAIGRFFEESPEITNTLCKLLFQNTGSDSIAKEIFLIKAVEARKKTLADMLAKKQLVKGTDIDLYAHTLISVTWGTALFWVKGALNNKAFRAQFKKSSIAVILPAATKKARNHLLKILDDC